MSIYSMTGYAHTMKELGSHNLSIELRAVNHRFLEINFRLPEELRPQEAILREQIGKRIGRGKVECKINLTPAGNSQTTPSVNEGILQQLLQLADRIHKLAPHMPAATVGDILQHPALLNQENTSLPAATIQNAALSMIQTAMDDFQASRAREGQKLSEIILARVADMDLILEAIRPLLPSLVSEFQQKIIYRLYDALNHADEERVRQEVTLYAQKIDIAEEVDRLNTHLSEIRRILKDGGIAGKRLDFLMQELNREANTLGSKSVAVATSQAAVELKVLIEQMREQIQNLE